LKQLKNKYVGLIETNKESCLGYMKNMNDLRYQCENPTRYDYEKEVFTDMHKYVLGNEKVSQCNILNVSELKHTVNQPQQKVNTPKNDKIKIGEYGGADVMKYVSNPNKIFVSALNKEFDLQQQPRVTNEAIHSEGSIQDRLKTVRYYILNDKEMDNKEKECIGWVNDINQTVGLQENRKTNFYSNEGIIKGFNLFGSIYIGSNNPTDADGNSNFDLPAQDPIDEAAKQHDNCYDMKGAK
jgi:hypothetical protein